MQPECHPVQGRFRTLFHVRAELPGYPRCCTLTGSNNKENPMSQPYATTQPDRASIDALPGVVALDFGTNWCGYCKAAEPVIDAALAAAPGVSHMKIEDGPGRLLGRAFRVKLWPTVVVLKDGQEVARVVRPADAQAMTDALAKASV
jgi:thioredoxin 1